MQKKIVQLLLSKLVKIMTNLNISLPDSLSNFINEQVAIAFLVDILSLFPPSPFGMRGVGG